MQTADVGKGGRNGSLVAFIPPVGRGTLPLEKAAHGAAQAATVGKTVRAATLVRDGSVQ